ncbi:hypothetical protein NA57DRAFT_24211, partial [Rhizodiscina lignyota]
GQSLDDIINQNAKQMRRRSVPYNFHGSNAGPMEQNPRRLSMMEFGDATSGNPLETFQFDSSVQPNMDGFMGAPTTMQSGNDGTDSTQASVPLALNTQFANQNYSSMGAPGSAYASPMHPSANMDMDVASPYLNSGLQMSMDMVDPAIAGMMGNETPTIPYYGSAPPQQFTSTTVSSPMHPSFAGTAGDSQLPKLRRGSTDHSQHQPTPETTNTTPDILSPRAASSVQSTHSSSRQPSVQPHPIPNQMTNVSFGPDPPQQMSVSRDPLNQIKVPWTTPPGGFPSTMHGRPHMQTQYKDAYSSTGFDMLNVLMRVATRPNPEINIGSVDLSCAFVVTDAEKDDNPIVYCSENFERLTGYTKHMILGRNCRFLQSPDGNVEAGVKRKYVDDDSVLYLKNTISARREAQISLINYRRGGQPFMNLLTMIPVTMDGPNVKFFVGFQVDLVEQPNSVTSKNPDGSYTINYQRGLSMPRYIMHTPSDQSNQMDFGQTITRDDVSTVLTTLGTGESELSKRIWDKVLLENTDDVVHVLSLKGLFLYLSPSCRKVLEYDASELVGTALSSVCHPSDIVPVTRELKDTSSSSSVNVVFRIRRKNSGYMWFESHGSLHTEQGKGRKCIILVGRERPVYTVSKNDIAAAGGIGENELWTKMSTSGMFLFVSANVRQLLDRQPEELVGTSIQALMRPESKQEVGRMLAMARTGKKASVQHEMMNKRGQVLKAFTTIYPGDAVEGQKPTFVVAQTRLIRFQRGGSASVQRMAVYPKQNESNGSHPGISVGTGDTTPMSSLAGTEKYVQTDGAPITYAGQQGLTLGRQDAILASEENLFDELKTTRSTSWQYELRQMERRNRLLAEEVQGLLASKKKRKRRKGAGQLQKDCANCHTRTTPEWRRGPSGNRDLCNSCGLRWAKQNGRISPRASSQHSVHSAHSDKASKASASPLHNQISASDVVTSAPSAAAKASMKLVVPHHQKSNPNGPVPLGKTAARIDAAASQGLVNLPPKIDEGIEP